jgi:CRP/FNR family transcriptional regulator
LSSVFPEVRDFPALENYQWRKQSFRRGEVIFDPGRPCNRFLLLGKGVLRIELRNPQGRSVVLYRVEAGQLCIHSLINLLRDEHYQIVVVAEIDGWFCWATKEQFHEWMVRESRFHNWVLNNIGARFKQVVDLFAKHAFLPVEARLAGLLIEKMGPDQTVVKTQAEIAAELGTAREIVSRHINRWTREGLLETRRGTICIKDIEALVNLAV